MSALSPSLARTAAVAALARSSMASGMRGRWRRRSPRARRGSRADDHRGEVFFAEEPGEGELRHADAGFAAEGVERGEGGDDLGFRPGLAVGGDAVVAAVEAGDLQVVGDGGDRAVLAGEEALGEGAVGDDRHAGGVGAFEDGALDRPPEQVVGELVANRVGRGLRQCGERLQVPGANCRWRRRGPCRRPSAVPARPWCRRGARRGWASGCNRDRHGRCRGDARLASSARGRVAGKRLSPKAFVATIAASRRPEGAADDRLRAAVAIAFGGVDEADAAVEGGVDGPHRVGVILRAPVLAIAHGPGAEGDARHLDPRPGPPTRPA